MSNQKPWQWERRKDTEGWATISVPTDRRRTSKYTPTAADVGYSLRASVEYIAHDGNQVRVTTEPSSPVALEPPPDRSRTIFFFLDIFPVDGADISSFTEKQEGFLRLEFIQDSLGVLLDERCMAVRFPLPPFDIAQIRTGESTDEGRFWEAEVSFDE